LDDQQKISVEEQKGCTGLDRQNNVNKAFRTRVFGNGTRTIGEGLMVADRILLGYFERDLNITILAGISMLFLLV
jgi:hypothetical protein